MTMKPERPTQFFLYYEKPWKMEIIEGHKCPSCGGLGKRVSHVRRQVAMDVNFNETVLKEWTDHYFHCRCNGCMKVYTCITNLHLQSEEEDDG
jgi:hypothetical protein